MPKIEVQETACANCGAEGRPDTAFCYNCGAAVTNRPENEKGLAGPADNGSAEGFLTEPSNGMARVEDRRPAPPKYESAAGLRRRSKVAARKPVEVTWVPEPESANITFIIASLILLVMAIILIVAAFYLK
jgi:uncharacterized OB-fold protein